MRVIKEEKNKWRDSQCMYIDQKTQYFKDINFSLIDP